MEDGGMRNDVSFLFQLNIKVQVRLVETNEIILKQLYNEILKNKSKHDRWKSWLQTSLIWK